jgi:hypothetical protein
VNKNLQLNNASSIGAWKERHGLFTGRSCFIFPEYSRWVRLGSNTLAMMKICIKTRGYGRDIFGYQGDDENPLSIFPIFSSFSRGLDHWIYDSVSGTDTTGKLMSRFLRRHDGVHTLLLDRDEIGGKYFLPSIPGHLKPQLDAPTSYSPAHLHHNWPNFFYKKLSN